MDKTMESSRESKSVALGVTHQRIVKRKSDNEDNGKPSGSAGGSCGNGKMSPGFGFTHKTKQYRNDSESKSRSLITVRHRRTESQSPQRSYSQPASSSTSPYKTRDNENHMCSNRNTTDNEYGNNLVPHKKQCVGSAEKTSDMCATLSKALEQSETEFNDDTRKPSIEIDTIIIHDPLQRYDVNPRKLQDVPTDYVDNSTSDMPNDVWTSLGIRFFSKKPDQTDIIYITHKYQTDSDLGDRYGAKLVTFKPTPHFHYHRHFLCSIDDNSPAQKMRIKEWDELVLINNAFVPDMIHSDVLNTFHELIVNGKTRLYLIIRRLHKFADKKKPPEWQWIDTSAILAPDHRDITPDRSGSTTVTHERFHVSNEPEHTSKTLYKFQVQTISEYMSINKERGVSAVANDENEGDSTKVWNIEYLWYNKEERKYVRRTELQSFDNKWYINISNDNVVISAKSQLMEGEVTGEDCTFSFEGRYMACNKKTKGFEAQTKAFLDNHKGVYCYKFAGYKQEETSLDCPDGASAFVSGIDCSGSESHGTASSRSSLGSSLNSSYTSSHESMDTECNDDLHSSGYMSTTDEVRSPLLINKEMEGSCGVDTCIVKTPTTPMNDLSLCGVSEDRSSM